MPRAQRPKDLGMREMDAGRIARLLVGIEREACAFREIDRAGAEGADPQLGTR